MGSKVIKTNILSEEVTYYFEEHLGGVYSDVAWYDLLEKTSLYLYGNITESRYISHLEFVFGFEGKKDLDYVLHKANKRMKKLEKLNGR